MTGLLPSALELVPRCFGGVLEGCQVSLYVLRNAAGMTACVTNYGAKIEQLLVPDSTGSLRDVVLGYDSLYAAVHGAPSVGAFIGRYAGRIAQARFTLDGNVHTLSANNGPHCLHGGLRGSRFRVFDAVQRNESSVDMNYVFEDGEEGFPGTLALHLTYSLTDANELVIDYQAVALDKPGVASFTTHGFFNLDGHSSGSAMEHEMTICANQYLAADSELINTGERLRVGGTGLDFSSPMRVRSMVEAHEPGVRGYDTCYVLDKPEASALTLAARVRAPTSGIVMEVLSTEPVMQFFTGLQAGEPLQGGAGKEGVIYRQQDGLCLEPQGYPNAPNCSEFPSALITPGRPRVAKTIYRFSA